MSEGDPPEAPGHDLPFRWVDPPASELSVRRVEQRRLADTVRIIIDRLVATAAPTEDIVAVTDELSRVARLLDGERHGTIYEGFSEATLGGGDPGASFDLSPFIGKANPLSPPIRIEQATGRIVARAEFGAAYEGPPGCVHGGYVAGAFDEVLGATQTLSGNPGMTASLTVDYRAPTPLHTELTFVGELDRVEGRKIFTTGTLTAGGELCAEARGLFVSVPAERFASLLDRRAEVEQRRLDR